MDAAVVEIGSALREARERLGLELGDVERETRIRTRYLAALEQERFELLPGRAYAKGFLRVYAEFVGLDARLLVEAFDARVPEPESEPAAPAVARRRTRAPRPRALPLALVAVVLAAAAIAAWQLSGSNPPKAAPPRPRTSTHPTSSSRPVANPTSPTPSWHMLLVLRARGPCWLWIRSGSVAGAVLYEKTLPAGGVLRYTLASSRPQLWVRVGAPWNLALSLGGKPVRSLPGVPTNVLVGRRGITPA